MELDDFTQAYAVCALWSSTDDKDHPLDDNYDVDDIAPETMAQMIADCTDFQKAQAKPLAQAYERYNVTDGSSPQEYAGHDFWLTRNHHGAGFWDRDLGEVGQTLTEAAQVYGGVDLYVGDDGKIHS